MIGGDLPVTVWAWVIVATLGIVCLTFLIIAAIRMEKPLKHIATSSVQGLCALGLLNAFGGLTGVSMGFSWLSMAVSAALGIPGVIGMVTMSTILNM